MRDRQPLEGFLERHCPDVATLYRVTWVPQSLFVPQSPHPFNGNIHVFPPPPPHGERPVNSSGRLGMTLCKCVNFRNGF